MRNDPVFSTGAPRLSCALVLPNKISDVSREQTQLSGPRRTFFEQTPYRTIGIFSFSKLCARGGGTRSRRSLHESSAASAVESVCTSRSTACTHTLSASTSFQYYTVQVSLTPLCNNKIRSHSLQNRQLGAAQICEIGVV